MQRSGQCATVSRRFASTRTPIANKQTKGRRHDPHRQADSSGPSSDRRHGPSVTTYATGLTSPRGLTFGPDRKLYVAEAGVGGELTPTGEPGCPVNINVFSPYTAGYSGRVIRVSADGSKETVVDNLPSMTDNSGASYGPTDVAFIGKTLYVLIEMGGCSHAMPDDLPAILRVNRDGSTTNVANLNAWHAANPHVRVRQPCVRQRQGAGTGLAGAVRVRVDGVGSCGTTPRARALVDSLRGLCQRPASRGAVHFG